MVLTTKTNNEYKPVAGLRCCRLTGLNATSLNGQWWRTGWLIQSAPNNMKENQFNEKVETLIKEAIDAHKRYEKIFKSRYNTYLEYETGTKERRRELSSLIHQGDDYLDVYSDKIADLGKNLNTHDFDIALRKINKEIISDQKLWNGYFEWKSNWSTMVV